MAYAKRGPWVDGQQFTADDANAFDEAIAQFNGRTVVDLGDVSGAVTIDCNVGGVFRANLTADAALTITNAATAGLSRTTELMLSTNGYVPTFPGAKLPKAGLSGDYVGVVDRFVAETNPGQTTPLVRHIAGYGRYRPAFLGFAGTTQWSSDDGGTWTMLTQPSGFLSVGYLAYSKAVKVFVGIGLVQQSPSVIYGIVTSRDGRNWTQQTTTFPAASAVQQDHRLDWNGRFNRFEFQIDGTTVYESTDGRTWATRTRTGLPIPASYDYSPGLGFYLARAGTMQYVYKSTDRLAWTAGVLQNTQPTDMRWMDAWGKWVQYGGQWVQTSTDGATWGGSFAKLPAGNFIRNAAYDGTTLAIAAEMDDGFGDTVYVSSDGAGWDQSSLALATSGEDLRIFWGGRLGRWLVWFRDSARVQISSDAHTWSALSSIVGGHPSVMVCGD